MGFEALQRLRYMATTTGRQGLAVSNFQLCAWSGCCRRGCLGQASEWNTETPSEAETPANTAGLK